KDRRVFQDRASDGEALLLAARKEHSFIPNHRVIAVRLFNNELVRISGLRRRINFFARGPGPAEKNVIVNGIVEQKCVLRHKADLFAQGTLSQRPEITTINPHGPRSGIVQAQDERENRALAGSAWADKGISFSRFNLQAQILYRLGSRAGVAKRYVFEIELAA